MLFCCDIYDTCITRSFARPGDLFAAWAEELLAADAPATEPSAEQLAELCAARLGAERRVRAQARELGREDVVLSEIYAAFPSTCGVDAERAMAVELALERAAARPVPAMRRRLAELRGAGTRIVFISDMYLPGAFLAELLLAHGLAAPGEPVYVSGEVGLTKRYGTLFRHVLAREGVRAAQALHVGDNPVSDGRSAKRMGLRIEPFTAAILNQPERLLVEAAPQPSPARRCATLRSRVAGAARLARLETEPELGPAAAWGAGLAGPLMAAFGLWLLERGREDDVSALYCVARDCQLAWRMAQMLAPEFPDAPRLEYLYGSRQAWFLAALRQPTPDELGWLLVPGHSRKPEHLLAKLRLSPKELAGSGGWPRLNASYWREPLPRQGETEFLTRLGQGRAAGMVRERAARARELAVAYLHGRGLGVPDAGRVAIADLGWTLKCQRALNRILDVSGEQAVPGYYLALSAARLDSRRAGPYRAMILEPERYLEPGEPLNALFRNANLIEQVLAAADHGRTTGYARRGKTVEPVLAPAAPGAVALARAVQSGALAFLRHLLASNGSAANLSSEELLAAALETLLGVLSDPDPTLVRGLAGVLVHDDQNEARSRPLAAPLGLHQLLAALAGRWPGRYAQGFDWIEGSLALSAPLTRRLGRRPRCFAALRARRMAC